MGLIVEIIKRLIRLLIYFTIFAAIIVLIPSLPPYTKFTAIKLASTQPSVGTLAPNGVLNNAEKLYKDKLLGPEAFQLYNGEVYTSLATGEIVKVSSGGHVTFVTKIGQPCVGISQEHICGRPLGFQINEKTNSLYVADAYHGIWKIDLKTDKKQLLVSPDVPIKGRKPKLFNSLALANNGDIYWTDSSSDFHLKDGVLSLLADPSGRLLYYNTAKNQSNVLLDDMWFPNGIVISSDHQFVLISETSRYRVVKYYIDGQKKGTYEVFIDGLPGTPDNLRSLPDGSGVLLALYASFDDNHPNLLKTMSETPVVRKFLARIQSLIEMPFEYLNSLYPHVILEEIIYFIGHFRSLSGFSTGTAGLIQLDWNGKVIASYFNTDGTLGHISDAIVYNGKLYTGNPHVQNFIGSVTAPPLLLNAFNMAKKIEKNVVTKESKPHQQSPPPSKIQSKPIVENNKVPKPIEPVASKPVHKPIETPKSTTHAPEKKQPAVDAKSTLPAKAPTPTPIKQTEQKVNPEIKLEPTKQTTPPPKEAEPKQATKADFKPSPKPEIKTDSKPVATPTPKPEIKPSPKPEVTPKLEVKAKSTPEARPTAMPKTADIKHSTEKPNVKQPPPQKSEKKKSEPQKPLKQTKQEIPIKEEIKSDTAKPNKDTLKVIKKGGPAEIPNPNLV